VDNVFLHTPLLFWLKESNRRKILNGGYSIVEPLMYGKNTTVKSYSGYEELDTTPQEGITSAEFNWKQVAGSISISREEERKNNSEHAIVNLLESKMQQTELSLEDALTAMLYSDGTGNSGKDILGLLAICADAPATGILGGIDRATNTWWRNYAVSGVQSATAFDNLLDRMETMYNTCSKGSDHPEIYVSGQTVFEGYKGLLLQNERYTKVVSEGKMAKLVANGGFTTVMFNGIPVIYDDQCPAGKMYGLNSKYLKWVADTETNFITTDFVRPEDKDAKTAQILFMGNLTVANCARQGVIYGIT
jgi:hypothetical protein